MLRYRKAAIQKHQSDGSEAGVVSKAVKDGRLPELLDHVF